jgi:K+-transporting ATPase c subunit
MALPNVNPPQLNRIATIVAWMRANHGAIQQSLTMTASLAAAFGQDPNLPPADVAAWQQLAADCNVAISTFPTNG